MTLNEFIALDYEGRMRATSKAVYVAGRDIHKVMVLLYQLNDFYIEVFYHKKYNYIAGFVAFDSTEGLLPYLDKIEIGELLGFIGGRNSY